MANYNDEMKDLELSGEPHTKRKGMEFQELRKRFSEGSLLGYISSEDIGLYDGVGRLAGMEASHANAIASYSFALKDDDLERMKEVEKRLIWNKVVHRNVDQMWDIAGIEEWREDNAQGLMIQLNKGYKFKSLGKKGLPIVGLRKLVMENNYYKGFGYPKIYSLEDGKKVIGLDKEVIESRKRNYLNLLMTGVSIPLIGGVAQSFNINDNYIIAGLVGYGALTVGYLSKQFFKFNNLVSRRYHEIKPKFEGKEALEKLCAFD